MWLKVGYGRLGSRGKVCKSMIIKIKIVVRGGIKMVD